MTHKTHSISLERTVGAKHGGQMIKVELDCKHMSPCFSYATIAQRCYVLES